MSADDVYYRLVCREPGLFGVAFFGERGTPRQYRRLAALWRQARRRVWGRLSSPPRVDTFGLPE